jgi:hypothetical protein
MSYQSRITISSPPDREKLVAEIFFQNEQWAEINQERDELLLEIYPKPDGGVWQIDLKEALEALTSARKQLLDCQQS